ncbi:MAG: protein kinase [Kofleriaceae bacterium]
MAPPALVTGDVIGEYRVVTPLGGDSFRAIHIDGDQRVVIRVAPHKDLAQTSVINSASRKLGALDHPGIVRVVAHGLLPDQRAWIATEHRDGTALTSALTSRLLRVDELASLIHDVAMVLAYAHDRDVIHGRLRLESVTLGSDGRFPIAIGEWVDVVDETSRCELADYAAPEASTMAVIDGRLDVYALGVIAYRAFTGRFPPIPVGYIPGVPPSLGGLMTSLLAADPEHRPTAGEALAAIAALIGGSGPIAMTTRDFDQEDPVAVIHADSPATVASGETDHDDVEIVIEVGDAIPRMPRFARPKWTPAPGITTAEAATPALPSVPKRPKL